MSAKNEVRKIYHNFLEDIENCDYDEDELFDLSHDLSLAVQKSEFSALNGIHDGDEVDEELWGAVTSMVSTISDRVRRNQTKERTRKMVRITLKRARAILSRIKPVK